MTCRSCGKPIVWMLTKKGKRIPVDYQEGLEEGQEFDHNKHISHFATCPQATQWRKPKEV